MAKNKKYRKYPGPQKGNPMWRDPSHAGGGKSGCPLSVLIMLVMIGAPVAGAVYLIP